MSVITKPDVTGLGCDYQPWSFDLNGKRAIIGLPNMPNYNLGKLEGSPCDTLETVTEIPTKSFDLFVSPNPANELVNIRSSKRLRYVAIFNALGEIVYQTELPTNDFFVSTKSFASGVYFVKVETDNNTLTRKFIVAKE